MNLVLDHRYLTIVGCMPNQMICGMNFDVLAISTETLHQIGSTLKDSRPSREIVEDFIDDIVSDTVEEVFAVNERPQRAPDQIEVRADWLVDSVRLVRHVHTR